MGSGDLDRDLLCLRDELELNAASGDATAELLLPYVRDLISERARQACLDAEPGDEQS